MLPSATPCSSIRFNSACGSGATNFERKAYGNLTLHGCGPLDGAKNPRQMPLSHGICGGFLTPLEEVFLARVCFPMLCFGIVECNSTPHVFIPKPNEARLACKLYSYKPGLHAVFCTRGRQHSAKRKRKCRHYARYIHDSRVNASIKEV